ncbi:MAG: hypothetical protein U0835_10875 [Isosphaeraceae bacterium]
MSATLRKVRVRRAPRLESLEDRRLLSIYTVENIVFGGQSTASGYVQVRNKVTQETVKDLSQSNLPNGSDRHAGMAFDASGNLYVSNYLGHSINKYDPDGNLLGYFGDPADFVSTTPGTNSYVGDLAVDQAGNVFTASPQNGDGKVRELDPTGVLIHTFSPDLEIAGTGVQSIAIAADQHTLIYTAFGKAVKTFDLSTNTQGPDLNTTLPGDHAGAVRVLPDGSMLVADWQAIVHLDSDGAVLKTYATPVVDTPDGPQHVDVMELALDPDGTSFWVAEPGGGIAWRIDISSGAELGQAYPYSNMGIESLALGTQPLAPAASADLAVTAVNPTVSAAVGGSVSLVYRVTNHGPDAATGVVLTSNLPAGLNFVRSTPGGTLMNGTVSVPVGTLASGATATVTLVVSPTVAARSRPPWGFPAPRPTRPRPTTRPRPAST